MSSEKNSRAKVLALIFCICLFFSYFTPFHSSRADEYVKSDSDKDSIYYIIKGQEVKDLFNFTIYNKGVDDIISWAFEFRTFTVIKGTKNKEGNTQYKAYFNTPNLQMLAKNGIVAEIDDGYTDGTYDPNETQRFVKIGKEASSENVITKYGFDVPNNTYYGEYPKEDMSVAGVIPTKWYKAVWRFIKSLFGFSFIKAPDADNFNTIKYMNHGYYDKNEYLLDFFKYYYVPYFVESIATPYEIDGYFANPKEVIRASVSENDYNTAKDWLDDKMNDVEIAKTKENACEEFKKAAMEEPYLSARVSCLVSGAMSLQPNAFWLEEGETLENKNGYTGGVMSPINFFITCPRYVGAIKNYIFPNGTEDEYIDWDRISYIYAAVCTSESAKTTLGAPSELMSWGSKTAFKNKLVEAFNNTEMLKALVEVIGSSNGDPIYGYGRVYRYEGTETNPTTKSDNDVDAYAESSHEGNLYTKKYYIANSSDEMIAVFSGQAILDFFKQKLPFCIYEWQGSDWLTEDEAALLEVYNDMYNLVYVKYKNFKETMESGDKYDPNSKDGIKYIAYRQCLIPNTGKDGECKNDKYGTEVSFSVADVYAYSGLWEITQLFDKQTIYSDGSYISPDPLIFEDYNVLTDNATNLVLTTIQNYCGPYYTDVLANMIKLMVQTAKYKKDDMPLNSMHNDDPRVMPFDTATMTAGDRENYATNDPRVEIYKSHIIGQLVTTDFDFSVEKFIFYIRPHKTLISFIGKITELSVFMQQLISFDYLDDVGLSPVTMWDKAMTAFIMSCLALFFIVKTITSYFKQGTNSLSRSLIGFMILVLELGFFALMSAQPERLWNSIKNIENNFIYLGEDSVIGQYPELQYLYGDAKDKEVTYYLPYLNAWSKYNTGHGIMDKEQRIVQGIGLPELEEATIPKIGSNEIQHWSVLLMDSFSYYGESVSPISSISEPVETETGAIVYKRYNGPYVNNNAYRVVDHFLAPRVNITENYNDDGTVKSLNMKVTANENYNGEFQTGILTLIVNLLLAILICFLSLCKLLTFLWQWFMFYTFIFKTVLAKSVENKQWRNILLETFAPTIALIVMGLYTGTVLLMGLTAEGITGIFLLIGLFILTFGLLRWWHNYRGAIYFPKTMVPIYYITNLKDAMRKSHARNIAIESNQVARDAGFKENMTLKEKTELIFNEQGMMKDEFLNKNNIEKQKFLDDWYKQALRTKEGVFSGREEQLPEHIRLSMAYFEEHETDRAEGLADSIHKADSKLKKQPKINKKNSKEPAVSKPTKRTSTTTTDTNKEVATQPDGTPLPPKSMPAPPKPTSGSPNGTPTGTPTGTPDKTPVDDCSRPAGGDIPKPPAPPKRKS